jgi:hypothetical protein
MSDDLYKCAATRNRSFFVLKGGGDVMFYGTSPQCRGVSIVHFRISAASASPREFQSSARISLKNCAA